MALIEIRNLTKIYGKTQGISNLNLSIMKEGIRGRKVLESPLLLAFCM